MYFFVDEKLSGGSKKVQKSGYIVIECSPVVSCLLCLLENTHYMGAPIAYNSFGIGLREVINNLALYIKISC